LAVINQRPAADGEYGPVADVAPKVIGLSEVHDVPQSCCDPNSINRIAFGLPTIAFQVSLHRIVIRQFGLCFHGRL
jgi:hypothetical protein